jgi:hypothetical protein
MQALHGTSDRLCGNVTSKHQVLERPAHLHSTVWPCVIVSLQYSLALLLQDTAG